MKVCVAEKPSVAREIAQVIGATSKKDGFYEGNGYQVTWTFGHFCSLYYPEDYHPHWKSWNLDTLPMLPNKFSTKLLTDEGVVRQFGVIQRLFNEAEEVINCGDAGQEGELIQRWVMNQAGYAGKVKRLWISSLTTEAIKEGFEKLMEGDDFDSLYHAGYSRAIGDWLLGINATRLFTIKYGGNKQILSIGRVQTPTLAMLVERQKEIDAFVSKPYWELETTYKDVVFSREEGRFEDVEKAKLELEVVSGKELEIIDLEIKEGKEGAPRLFDLTSLQVYCNNKFGFTADQTLKIAQKLYEQKVITYPRVDTTFLPNDQYEKVPSIMRGMRSYQSLTEPLLTEPLRKSSKVFNDKKVTDHHAIIPTGQEQQLSVDETRVYDAVARHFIAVFYPDCKVSNTSVKARVEQVEFKATGKQVLEPGWRAVMPVSKKQSSAEEAIMPDFEVGERGEHLPEILEKNTKAPRNYTEATLLRAMETAGKQVEDEELRDALKANGIGRPSTRASIIETLFKREYITRKKKLILPTPLGMQLIDRIDNELLKSVELTGQWEKLLREIEDGEVHPNHFISSMKQMVEGLVDQVRSAAPKPPIDASLNKVAPAAKAKKTAKTKGPQGMDCPKCSEGSLLKGKSAYGCSRYNAGCDYLLPFEFAGKKLSDNQLKRLLDKGATVQLKGFVLDGEKVDGKVELLSDGQLKLITAQEVSGEKGAKEATDDVLRCPKCNKGEVVKGKTAFGCSAFKEGCDFKVSFAEIKERAAGRPIDKQLVREIILSSAG